MTDRNRIVLDDRHDFYSDVCLFCSHLKGFLHCVAFDEIPLPIWNGKHKHHKPYPGDNGIRFTPKEK